MLCEVDNMAYVVHDIRPPDVGLGDRISRNETGLGDFEEGRARCLGSGGISNLGEVDDCRTVVVSANGLGRAVAVSRLLVHLH